MICVKVYAFVLYINMCRVETVRLDVAKCGMDDTPTVEGTVRDHQYPWLGVLFYSLYNGMGETRSVTTVVLIHVEFVIANSADIGPMPKRSFREKAHVLLGEGWERGGRRVRNYIVHPEYGETVNSVAIVHLRQPVRTNRIVPICPPPERIRYPGFWVVKFEDKLENLQKNVLPVVDVRADQCRDFYVNRSLYEAKRRPSFVKCTVSLADRAPCVWNAGAALVSRDVWGRWQLLGLGTYGPGCGAPARFLDMLRYYPWIEDTLDKFQRVTISQIHKHKYVLRSGVALGSLMRFGDCDEYEMQNNIYRDYMRLSTSSSTPKIIKYNMSIFETVQYTCVTFEIKQASASAEMRVSHYCPRKTGGPACYAYKGTRFDISVDVIFMGNCVLDIRAYGLFINVTLIDTELWKWEEGTYYEDFRPAPVEYRGPEPWTLFGFEPLDDRMWVPDYDMWSTTAFTYTDTNTPTTKFPSSTYSTSSTPGPLKTFSPKRKKKWKVKVGHKPWYWNTADDLASDVDEKKEKKNVFDTNKTLTNRTLQNRLRCAFVTPMILLTGIIIILLALSQCSCILKEAWVRYLIPKFGVGTCFQGSDCHFAK